jgi:hypothetical protein
MKEETKISVVLPIKSGKSPFFDDYFNKAISSVKNQGTIVEELIIVHTDETFLTKHLNDYDFENLNVVFDVWTEEPNFALQVNRGFELAKSKWVSLLEFDDEYSNIWFKKVSEYIDIYQNNDVFLPVVVDVDEKGVFVGFTNEATFAANFSQEMGVLTNETLLSYQNFQISGMVIRKEAFTKYGMIKPSIKLTFGYELLLRLTHNSVNFMTIPKIGYKHTNLREGSIFWNYKNGSDVLSEDEVRFWIDTAKKEYFFIQDRNINYEPQEV